MPNATALAAIVAAIIIISLKESALQRDSRCVNLELTDVHHFVGEVDYYVEAMRLDLGTYGMNSLRYIYGVAIVNRISNTQHVFIWSTP